LRVHGFLMKERAYWRRGPFVGPGFREVTVPMLASVALRVPPSDPTQGEALPVSKQPLRVLPNSVATAIDAGHWRFAGTGILTGRATLRVVYTGPETLYGETVRSARSSSHARTPLQGAVASLVPVP
jgi:Ca2+-transporting ATPase